MQFDLFTLYVLAIGTLLLSAAMTVWEGEARPQRRATLRLFAGAYVMLAVGCVLATVRAHGSGPLLPALSNLSFMAGYLLILNGVAALRGRRYRTASVATLAAIAAIWAIGGAGGQGTVWNYVSAGPIALVSAATTWEVLRNHMLRGLRGRRVVIVILTVHAMFYVVRATALPLMVGMWGNDVLALASTLTMYEGVLYSVALPMSLLAMIREEAHDQLLQTSRTDYLTGLGNRRWFFEEGERVIARAGMGEPMSLLAFDLDHFKAINDRHGHATGDAVLKLFARVVRGATGEDTVLARIGGEEFAALLPGHARIHARQIGQVVAARFAESAASDAATGGVAATVSIGVAERGTDGETLADLLSAADRALYVAKARGRNRIEFAPRVALAEAC
jgi:diguanylate cyclase (GGDEF)-like protein